MPSRKDLHDRRTYAAHSKAGEVHWRWYVYYRPALRIAGPPALLAVAGVALWTYVAHWILAVAAGVIGLLLVAAVVVAAMAPRSGRPAANPAVLLGVVLVAAALFGATFLLGFA